MCIPALSAGMFELGRGLGDPLDRAGQVQLVLPVEHQLHIVHRHLRGRAEPWPRVERPLSTGSRTA